MSKSRGLVVLAVIASAVSFLSRTLDRTYEIEYGKDELYDHKNMEKINCFFLCKEFSFA